MGVIWSRPRAEFLEDGKGDFVFGDLLVVGEWKSLSEIKGEVYGNILYLIFESIKEWVVMNVGCFL